MISYSQDTGLVLNKDKTQLLVSSSKEFQMKVGSSLISSSPVLKLLGVEFDTNFSTTPSLKILATAAKIRASKVCFKKTVTHLLLYTVADVSPFF